MTPFRKSILWIDIAIEFFVEFLMMFAFGLFMGLGEKVVEHLEQWYLMRKFKQIQEEKRKKRGKVAKRQRR